MAYYYKKHWTVETTKKYVDYIFIYGDNDIQKGKGGQAIIRDEPNAFGIPTKKYPNNRIESFYSDDDYEQNCTNIKNAIDLIMNQLQTNLWKGIIYPKDGIGTGLAQLPNKAPKTYKFLQKSLKILFKWVKTLKILT